MITKNELAQALIESYNPNVYKKSQLVENNRRNKQSLYGMSQFNLPEEEEISNSTDSSFSELDEHEIIYEFYVHKRNPTNADIAKLQTVGIYTIPTVDCYWKFYNEAAKYDTDTANLLKQYNTPQALYAYIKKRPSFTWPGSICKSKYLFVSSSGIVLSYTGHNRYCYEAINFCEVTAKVPQAKFEVYDIIADFINGTVEPVKAWNNRLDPTEAWIKPWWEHTYGIKFNF